MSSFKFACSRELKQLFNNYYSQWSIHHDGGMRELAIRCGVSEAYLNHVKRYGRIPGQPVLNLLALNFQIQNPSELFAAAKSNAQWPYAADNDSMLNSVSQSNSVPQLSAAIQVERDNRHENGFSPGSSSLRNGRGYQSARPHRLRELTEGRPIRFGLSSSQKWLLAASQSLEQSSENSSDEVTSGFARNLAELLQSVLRHEVQTIHVPFSDHIRLLNGGQIDVFGPMVSAFSQDANALYSDPLFSVGLSALWKKEWRPSSSAQLSPLACPTNITQLRSSPYRIAVMENARGHLFANTRLGLKDRELLLCRSLEECVDAVTEIHSERAAHLCLIESGAALFHSQQNPQELELLFAKAHNVLDMTPNRLAVRSDWNDFIPLLNEAIRYLGQSGTLHSTLAPWIQPQMASLSELVRW